MIIDSFITLTYSLAVDAIFSRFLTDWTDGRVKALIGYDTAAYWQGKDEPNKPDVSKFWVRVSQQTVTERQTSLSRFVGTAGRSRYSTSGLVIVQLFCPKAQADSFETGRLLATIARDAFRGKFAVGENDSGKVVFYNARIQELTPELDLHRFNVIAEYEYDEIG